MLYMEVIVTPQKYLPNVYHSFDNRIIGLPCIRSPLYDGSFYFYEGFSASMKEIINTLTSLSEVTVKFKDSFARIFLDLDEKTIDIYDGEVV